jgi:serine protease Do
MSMSRLRISSLLLLLLLTPTFGETVKDRAGAVLADRSKMENDSRWIYNDWREGFKRAQKEKKPLLVVMRCVPCLACAGIDASVLTEPSMEPLLDQFVCVRVINANALDLSLFQFDYDLSFSSIIFNGDGTVYGRYGSWTHQTNSLDKDTEGLKKALEQAIAIHLLYPDNKQLLKGKQGVAMPVKDPLALPELAGKYKLELDWQGKIVQSCVHCHQVGDAMRAYYRAEKKSIPREWIYPMPPPETIGMTLDPSQIAHVQSVTKGSIADRSGIKPGDDFIDMDRQPLISVADVAWVLHHAPESGLLPVRLTRNGKVKSLNIELPADWRTHSVISRRVGTWEMRAMATGGLLLEDLTDEARDQKQIPKSKMALLVKHAGEYGKHAAAKKAGFQKDDVLVELDGTSERLTEGELIGRLLEKHSPGEKVPATVLRNGSQLKLELPMQ